MKEQVLDIYFSSTANYTVKEETLNGRKHLVVPVTMMVEGVHSGSHGPVLHLAEELGRYPGSWDGIPATIGHPKVNGQYVSANSPTVLQDWAVGRIFNTQMVNSDLKAELWLDEEDLERVSEDTLTRINNGEVIEVSIGIFSDEESTTGTWNTEMYTTIARNHRPDHLALLPDEVGACSITDGCGIRVNKKGKTKVKTKDEMIVNSENKAEVLKELNRLGFSVNEVSFNDIREKVSQVVYGLDGNGLDHYVEDIYPEFFVYSQRNYRVTPSLRKLFKQQYTINTANDLELVGAASNVKREVTYEVIPEIINNERVVTQRVIQKNKKSMCTECVKRLADGLINNKATAWSEDDREYLESQTEEQLEKMTPQVTNEPVTNSAVKLSREEILAVFKEQPMTNEEFLVFASPEVKEGLVLRSTQKAEMVSQIMANSDQWSEDELNGKELVELQKLYKVVTKDTDTTVYVGGGSLGGKTELNTNKKGPKTVMLPRGVKQ